MNIEAAPLVEARRNGVVEAQHRGYIAVVDAAGSDFYHLGDTSFPTFWRSSSKPVQALPVVESGAAEVFGLNDEEIARICGSYSHQSYHQEAVNSMLSKAGLHGEAMITGPASGCAGKHAGMLLTSLQRGYPLEGYYQVEHPVQIEIRRTIAELAGVPVEEVGYGWDGCGVPTWWMSVWHMAVAFSRLVAPPPEFGPSRQAACARIVEAMIAHPNQLDGPGLICSDLIRVLNPLLIAKTGADGLLTVGIRPGYFPGTEKGVGIAIKIEGGNLQAELLTAIETLRQLEVVQEKHFEALKPHWNFNLLNGYGTIVGELRPCFTLVPGRGA